MEAAKQILKRRIDQARGLSPADLAIKGARVLDIVSGEIGRGDIAICGDTIVGVHEEYRGRREIDGRDRIVVPGFIDSHLHVEGSLLTPFEFERCVLPRGTTTAICDPHEIANVLGLPGIRYVLDCAGRLRLDLRVQVSSCVPASPLETSGAILEAADLAPLRGHPKVIGLAEMMNFPGVLAKDDGILDKLAAFFGGHIDGHAPLLGGRDLNAYLACGIRNCHETSGYAEGLEKLRKGMQVLIREGSVARNLHALAPLITDRTSPFVAFCTDDRNPLDIVEEGHVDHLIRTAIGLGAPVAAVYRAASWSAARGFGLTDRGLIAPGQRADLVLLDDLESCAVHAVIKDGRPVAETESGAAVPPVGFGSIRLDPGTPELFAIPAGATTVPVIGLKPGVLLTDHLRLEVPQSGGLRRADPGRDILKLCVLERHGKSGGIGRGFVRGFGFPRGALASSVGHDSHNVIAVGSDDADMALAVNRLIELQGGYVAVRDGAVLAELPLPVAGLISPLPFEAVAERLRHLLRAAREMGCRVPDPFQALAFLPLSVIPHLRLTDRGMVDVDRFEVIAA